MNIRDFQYQSSELVNERSKISIIKSIKWKNIEREIRN